MTILPEHPTPRDRGTGPSPTDTQDRLANAAVPTGYGLDDALPDSRPGAPTPPAVPVSGPAWQVRDTGNPFTARLVLNEHPAPTLLLDPVTVRELLTALHRLAADQANALGMTVAPTRTDDHDQHNEHSDAPLGADTALPDIATIPPATDTALGATETESEHRGLVPWWVRHKILTGWALLIGLILLYGFIAGGTRV